jgi:molecular chaperone GrpE (heat shock protein)
VCEDQRSLPSDESADDRAGAAEDVGTGGAVSADGSEGSDGSDEPDSGRHSAPAHNRSDLEELLHQISWGVNRLQDLFGDRRRYDDAKEGAFQQLYEDLSQFRALAAAAQSNPILIEIIRLQDRVEESLADEPKHSFILSVRDELSEILARHGVVEIAHFESRFDPRTQRALSARDTPEEAKHKSVAEIKRKGYERNGQVLRATEVIVYRHVRV